MKRYRNMLALLLAVVMLAGMALESGFTMRRGTFITEVFEEDSDGYMTYSNDAVKFTMEYPSGYALDEPYENLVLVSSGDDFRVVAEYAYTTADGSCFLYSAADFASLINADRQVLADWLGITEFEVINKVHGIVAEKECYEYDFVTQLNGNQCSGSLLIFDGKGEFGCYCMQTMINEDSPNASKYMEQQVHMVETFTVTGAYQESGYTLSRFEDQDVTFISRYYHDVSLDDKWVQVYPGDEGYDAYVTIFRSSYDVDNGMEGVMDKAEDYYYNEQGDTQCVLDRQPLKLGKYNYTVTQFRYVQQLRYKLGNQTDEYHNSVLCYFNVGGEIWRVSLTCLDERMEDLTNFTWDILASLRIGGAAPGAAAQGKTMAAPASPEETTSAQEGDYSTYVNESVAFSLEYPAGMELTEPYENAVLIENDDGTFRMSAEYAYITPDGARFLYSAADFADQIDADQQVLNDWLGTDSCTLWSHDRDTSGERDMCWYFFQIEENGKTLDGSLTLFDGDGRFGCYCLQTLCDKDAYGLKYQEQIAHAQDTFQVTKACDVANFTVQHIDAWDLYFVTDDALVEDVSFSSDPATGETVDIHPVGAGMNDLSILISPLLYDVNETRLEDAANSTKDFILSAKEQAQVLVGPDSVTGVGRYDICRLAMSYYEGGRTRNILRTYLAANGRMWEINASFSDDYIEQGDTVVSELVSSLRFA